MMVKKSLRRGLTVAALAALLLLALGGCALTGGEEAALDIPEVTVSVTDTGLSIPADVPSGVVAFKLDGEAEAMPVRLNDGVTMDQLNEALAQPDPFGALSLVSMLGGGSSEAGYPLISDLKQGQYALISFGPDGPPSVVPFTAGEPSGATAPTPDVTVDLVDFSFALPAEIQTGPKVWQISNKGTQWHEMAIVKLAEGASIDDVIAAIGASEGPPSGPMPFEDVAFWSPISPGETGWVTWDLPPGEYTVLCFLPDLAGDMAPHVAHGMVSQLTVTQ